MKIGNNELLGFNIGEVSGQKIMLGERQVFPTESPKRGFGIESTVDPGRSALVPGSIPQGYASFDPVTGTVTKVLYFDIEQHQLVRLTGLFDATLLASGTLPLEQNSLPVIRQDGFFLASSRSNIQACLTFPPDNLVSNEAEEESRRLVTLRNSDDSADVTVSQGSYRFSPDGLSIFVRTLGSGVSAVRNRLFAYDMATPFDLGSINPVAVAESGVIASGYGFQFSSDGFEVAMIGFIGSSTFEVFALDAPFDISTLSNSSPKKSISVDNGFYSPRTVVLGIDEDLKTIVCEGVISDGLPREYYIIDYIT